MSAAYKNKYGTVTIDDKTISTIAGINATECYGLVGMSQKNIAETISGLFKSGELEKGVHIKSDESENIIIELYVTIKYGVSLSAVAENIIDRVKYSVEKDTGLNVQSVDIIVHQIQV